MKKTPPMKRFLSFMLALVMVLTMVPANGIHVHAHDSETAQTETTPEIPAEQQEQEQTDTPAEEVVVETVIGPETSALAFNNGYYEISTKEELIEYATTYYEANAKLMNDIDMGGYEWDVPIGPAQSRPFRAIFDGQGYSIKNLKIVDPTDYKIGMSTDVSGLFGWVYGGQVLRLNLVNCTIESDRYYSGGLAGAVEGGLVMGCSVTGTIEANNFPAGGLVGYCYGSMQACYAAVTVRGSDSSPTALVASSLSGVYYDSTLYGGYASGIGKTTAEFASGQVAYELSGVGFGQNLDNGQTAQTYPAYSGAAVYKYTNCKNEAKYSNTQQPNNEHRYSNGVCTVCGNSGGFPVVNGVAQISTKDHLLKFAEYVNNVDRGMNAIVLKDIDLGGAAWTPVASTGLYYKTTTYDLPDRGYTGTFDGNGHVISNCKSTTSTTEEKSYGLFGTLSGTVKNLGVTRVSYTFPSGAKDLRAAAIAGQMLPGSVITDCYVTDSSINPGQYIVGGVAACNYGGTIENCYTRNVTVSGNERCGNLVSDTRGDINNSDRPGTVKNCWTDASRVVGTRTGNKVTGGEASVSAERLDHL